MAHPEAKLTVAGRRLLVERELEQARLAAHKTTLERKLRDEFEQRSASAADGP